MRAAEVGGDVYVGGGWKQYLRLIYPDFDLCALLTDSTALRRSDLRAALEHVPDTCRAAANFTDLCEPGGHVIVSTPFLVRVDELPAFDMRHYWRFTPRALRTVLEGPGLEVREVFRWGNRDCVVGNFDRWPAYRWWHSLRNEPDCQSRWAFARRPSRG